MNAKMSLQLLSCLQKRSEHAALMLLRSSTRVLSVIKNRFDHVLQFEKNYKNNQKNPRKKLKICKSKKKLVLNIK